MRRLPSTTTPNARSALITGSQGPRGRFQWRSKAHSSKKFLLLGKSAIFLPKSALEIPSGSWKEGRFGVPYSYYKKKEMRRGEHICQNYRVFLTGVHTMRDAGMLHPRHFLFFQAFFFKDEKCLVKFVENCRRNIKMLKGPGKLQK